VQPRRNDVEAVNVALSSQPVEILTVTSFVPPTIGKQLRQHNGVSIKFGLLNAQSVRNKFTAIHGNIVDRNIESLLSHRDMAFDWERHGAK
jgi:hypothetical protein